jgi:hypothetical protein
LPDLSWYNKPKRKNIPKLLQKYQMDKNISNGYLKYQMIMKYNFPFQGLPKNTGMAFLV